MADRTADGQAAGRAADPAKILRFGLVGGTNFVVDFSLLFLLVHLGVPTVPANMVSTGVALSFSFLANRRFTFRLTDPDRMRTQVALFLTVTIFGLWVLQPLVILGVQRVAEALGLSFSAAVVLAAAKVAATGVTAVWNYVMYAKVVFRR